MHPLLKRILVNGLGAAGVLAVIGVGYAEVAGMWLAAGSSVRPNGAPATSTAAADSVRDTLRYRVPAMMAVWGFLFVALGEGFLYLKRGLRPVPTQPVVRQPDPAEALLEELLRQAEAAQQKAAAEVTPSPTPAPAENIPVHQ